MRIAVTGASGFCGQRIVVALQIAGNEVVGLGRRQRGRANEFRPWDASTEVPNLDGCDAVVHVAAKVGDEGAAREFEAVNVDGARRLLDVVGDRKLVWISSGSVYDPRIPRHMIDESHPTDGGHLSHYGRTKAIGDKMALEAGAVVLRPTAVYGPGERHLIPRLMRLVRERILLLPGPDVELSLTEVYSLARAARDGLDWAPGAYNIADPDPYSRDEVLVRVLSRVTGRELRPVHVPLAPVRLLGPLLPGVNRYSLDLITSEHTFDVRKARAAGWVPDHRRVWRNGWLDHHRVPTRRREF